MLRTCWRKCRPWWSGGTPSWPISTRGSPAYDALPAGHQRRRSLRGAAAPPRLVISTQLDAVAADARTRCARRSTPRGDAFETRRDQFAGVLDRDRARLRPIVSTPSRRCCRSAAFDSQPFDVTAVRRSRRRRWRKTSPRICQRPSHRHRPIAPTPCPDSSSTRTTRPRSSTDQVQALQ